MTDIVMETSGTVSDISVKPKFTAELGWNTSELKVYVLCPSCALAVKYYNEIFDHYYPLTVGSNLIPQELR